MNRKYKLVSISTFLLVTICFSFAPIATATSTTANIPSISAAQNASSTVLPRLTVSDNGRFLMTADGQPFFWLGDTAWMLISRLNREEVNRYLQNRLANGFNVIQIVILTEYDLDTPNAYGELALSDNDPLKPNEAYFEYVDWVIERAAELGLYVGLLPTWGDKVNLKNGLGPEIFTPANARLFGEFVGKRYGSASNVIWILGGDRNPENDTHMEIWREMAAGIEGSAGKLALITYHPRGQKNSVQWFNKDAVFDFNLVQSGQAFRDMPVWEYIAKSYEVSPAKPVFDAEINYEGHAVAKNPQYGYFTEYDVRKQSYRSVFAGGAGVTYGHHSIWQFFALGRKSIGFAEVYWYDALNTPGALEMRYLKQLMLSRPYFDRVPDPKMFLDAASENTPNETPATHSVATRASDGSYAMIYIPTNRPLNIDLSRLSGNMIRAWWYDPRTGESVLVGEFAKSEPHKFLPPANHQDWVLVLDDAALGFDAPGIVISQTQ
ncbi:MAG: glycoside hydrolase family 140 protein [Anaerolineae bacterium]